MLYARRPSYTDPAAVPVTILEGSRLDATVIAGGELQATVALAGELDVAGVGLLDEVIREQLSSGRRFVRLDVSRGRHPRRVRTQGGRGGS